MRKVLIISHSFPPVNNIASRRFSEIVPFFYDLGWEPHILTTVSEGDLVTDLPEENIFRIGKHPQGSTLRQNGPVVNGFFSKARRRLGFILGSFDSSYRYWYKPFILSDATDKFKKLNFDFIIASYGPSSGLAIGSKLSKELDVKWMADFRDLGALHEDKNIRKNIIFKILDKWHERKLIDTASLLATVSKSLADELELVYRKKTVVIYNGWSEGTTLTSASKETSFDYNKPYIFYAGRFYQHRLQAVFLILDAIKDEDLVLVIRSLGPDKLEQEIINYAHSKGILSKLILLQPAKDNVIAKEQAHSKINLVIEDFDKTYGFKKGVLTGKLMQLLTYNPPVLAVARDDSEIGEVLAKSKRGVLASTHKEIKDFIGKVNKYVDFCAIDLEAISHYSKKLQAIKLVKLMDQQIEKDIDKKSG